MKFGGVESGQRRYDSGRDAEELVVERAGAHGALHRGREAFSGRLGRTFSLLLLLLALDERRCHPVCQI